ncbi:HTH-type transcriptional regulator DmlR [Rhodoplanes serenus]|uniref:HTH-type transcriptional regulator DmlR n=2 Tax=Rhodoplanes serenus TaxID=200615 RepID=A0A447CP71_9BRAD|nr:LysR family transcriptional regulator [Rhodoplanes serenus]MBI5114111.1 LysR family transcriptional regulator [Rhodovulum sp.]VCU06925.1 HTH-type transcriptional regulator DmlR [Rhodoplanes serenus]
MTDQISDMRAFVQVVQRGSFSAAADDLGLTPSAVSKLVSRLEDRLGVRLLHRTTRRLALTPEGETYLVRARDILGAIDDAETEVARASTTPRGKLRLNTGSAFMLHELARALPDFLARYPEIEIDITVTDRVDNLVENADVAICLGPIADRSLVARRFAHTERGIFAAPAYLERRGVPRTPEDLAGHDCLVLSSVPSINFWPFRDGNEIRTFEAQGRLVVDDAEAALRLAIGGAGLVHLSDLLVGNAVRRGELVPLLVDHHLVEPVPLSAVYPQGRHRMLKVRVFIDFLVERFADAPWRAKAGHARVRTPVDDSRSHAGSA